MILTKLALILSVAFLLWWYVWRPIAAKWGETDATTLWGKVKAAFADFKTKAVARLAAILTGVAPLLANALGEFDLKAFLAAYPWAMPVALIALGIVIDFLRSFGKDDA